MEVTEAYEYLLHDKEGNFTGWLKCPCSRYGDVSYRCIKFAVAAWYVHKIVGEIDGKDESVLDYCMGLAVNDSPSIAGLLVDYWHEIPRGVRPCTLAEIKKLVK